jgi:hypothetical protein
VSRANGPVSRIARETAHDRSQVREPGAGLLAGAVRPGCAGVLGVRDRRGAASEDRPRRRVPLLAAVLWGVFESPRASLPLPEPWHLLFALAFFGCAAVALYAAHHAQVALVFALVVILNQVLVYIWGQ